MSDTEFQITPRILLQAYAMGIFPMAESRDDPQIHWIDPELRGILPLDGLHVSRSLARSIRRSGWTLTIDTAFRDVVLACADREETWISAPIHDLYTELFAMGFAHSIEIRDGNTLIGGCYGVALGGAFFGESMFSRRTDASKAALLCLVDKLNQDGFTLLDTQFLTPHLATLGGIEISRDSYHRRLQAALARKAEFSANLAGYSAGSPSPVSSSLSALGTSATSGGV